MKTPDETKDKLWICDKIGVTTNATTKELLIREAMLCDEKDEVELLLSNRNVTDEHGIRLAPKEYWALRHMLIAKITDIQSQLRWLRLLIKEREES